MANYIEPSRVKNEEVFKSIQDVAVCPICTGVVIDPQQCTKCENLFCRTCILKWNEKSVSCPYKCLEFSLRDPGRVVRSVLSRIVFTCPKNCACDIPYENYLVHVSECKNKIVDCPTCGNKVSEDSMIRESYYQLKIENEILKKRLSQYEKKNPDPVSEFEKEFEKKMPKFRKNTTEYQNIHDPNARFSYKFSCCNKYYDCNDCHNNNETHPHSNISTIACYECLAVSYNTKDTECLNCGMAFEKEANTIKNNKYTKNNKKKNYKTNFNRNEESDLNNKLYYKEANFMSRPTTSKILQKFKNQPK